MNGWVIRVDGSPEPQLLAHGLLRVRAAGAPAVEAFCPHCRKGSVLAQLYRDRSGAVINFIHVSAIPPGFAAVAVTDLADVSIGHVKTSAAPPQKRPDSELWELWTAERAPATDVRCHRCGKVSTIDPTRLIASRKSKLPAVEVVRP